MVEIYRNTTKGNKIVKYVPTCGLKGAGIINFFGCNLKCPFCFAQKYSYPDTKLGVELDTKNRINLDGPQLTLKISEFIDAYPDICYLQLTGGEPIKSNTDLNEIIHTLIALDDRGLRIIFQTNGLVLGRTPDASIEIISKLQNLEQAHVLFELSLKGTNPLEFQELSGSGIQEWSQFQYGAYWALSKICDGYSHLNLVARLGTGHHRKSISFVLPDKNEPMFLMKNWSPEFKEIYDDMATRTGFEKMVCETVNAEGDGGVNNYLRRSIPALARCAMHSCIQSRIEDSKASQRVSQTYGVDIPTNTRLQETYDEFIGLFEPMGRPDHNYCGRNEFPIESRNSCSFTCRWMN